MIRKFIGALVTASLALTGLAISPAQAVTPAPVLVDDTNKNPASVWAEYLVEHNGILYFAGSDQNLGRELFAHNLTSGITRVFDINLKGSSNPSALTIDEANNTLYFFTTSLKSTLTINKLAIGTNAVSTIIDTGCAANGMGQETSRLKVWQDDLYFYFCDQEEDSVSLWKYEVGSAATQISFPELETNGQNSPDELLMAVHDGLLYFTSEGNSEVGLIAETNGTSARYVSELSDLEYIRGMISFNGDLLISASPNYENADLYKLDGDTYSYVDQYNFNNSNFDAKNFTILNNKLYFSAYSQAYENYVLFELNTQGQMRALELSNVSDGFNPKNIVELGGQIYFAGDAGADNWDTFMYVFNGTTVSKMQNFPQVNYASGNTIVVVSDKMYFSAKESDVEGEIQVFDGTNMPTLLKNFNSGTAGSYLENHIAYAGRMYWMTWMEDDNISKLWTLTEQNKPVQIVLPANSRMTKMKVLASGVYFWLNSGEAGFKPWRIKADGSLERISDQINYNPWGSEFAEVGGKVFTSFDDSVYVLSSQGLFVVESSGLSVSAYMLVAIGTYVYFSAQSTTDGLGYEIYRWNGVDPAELAADVWEGSSNSYPWGMIQFNSKLYFLAQDGSSSQNPSAYGAYFLYSLSITGALTKLSETTCSWECNSQAYLSSMTVVGNALFALTNNGDKQHLLKLNPFTNSFAYVMRDGEKIEGVSRFFEGNTMTAVTSFSKSGECVVQRLNSDGTFTDLFSNNNTDCLMYQQEQTVIDLHGNLYFAFYGGASGQELFMLPGAGAAVKPGKISKLALAKNGATKSSLKLSWKAPALNGGKAVTNYKVEYSLNGKKWTLFKHKVSKAASIVITKLRKKTKYFVRVSAITSKGTGAATTVKVSTK